MSNETAKSHISAARQGIEDAIGELTVDGLRAMELTRVTKAVEVLRATVTAVDAAFSALLDA